MFKTHDYDLEVLYNGPSDHQLSFIDCTSPELEEFSCSIKKAATYIVNSEWKELSSPKKIKEIQDLLITDPAIFSQDWIEAHLNSLFVSLRLVSHKPLPKFFFMNECQN